MSIRGEFTPHQEKTLVEQVSRYPCIYDASCEGYKDINLKENEWKEIARFVSRPVDQCKWRWRNIKDTYVKKKRKGKLSVEHIYKKWHLSSSLNFLDDVQFKKRNVASAANIEKSIEFINVNVMPLNGNPLYNTSEFASNQLTSECTQNHIGIGRRFHDIHNAVSITTDHVVDSGSTRRIAINTNKIADSEKHVVDKQKLDRSDLYTDVNGTQEDHVDMFFKSVALSVKSLPKHLINQAKLRTLQMLVELEADSSASLSITTIKTDSTDFSPFTDTIDGSNSCS